MFPGLMEDTEDVVLGPEGVAGERAARRIVAVGGGKGGAGKSLLAANLGIYLATLGKKVVLLDADLGGANLHTFLGVDRPRVTLADLFEKRVARVEDVVVETQIPGLGLVSGEGDPSWIANPRPAQKFRLLNQVQQLQVDYLVVDLGPGSGSNALDFFLVADVGLLVVVPEPTSVENTFRFVKSAFLRRLRGAGLARALDLLQEGDHSFEGGIPAPLDLYLAAREVDESLADELGALMRAFRPRIVVNQARARSDLELGPTLVTAARRRLGVPIDYLGHVEHDDAVWLAVRKRRPLLIEQPDSEAAQCVERVARRLLAIENEKPTTLPVRAPSDLTHYEALEIDPAAADEDIRRAYRRVREVYGHESMVVFGLYGRERLAALQLRIDEAYETLMDATRRRTYDRALFPEGRPTVRPEARPPEVAARRRPASPQPAPGEPRSAAITPPPDENTPAATAATPERPVIPEPVISPGTDITGALFRQLREARGIDLTSISQRTKIAASHLRAIEEERFQTMPAPVYVRGFLIEYAKFLRLDVAQVLATYLTRFQAQRRADDDSEG